MTSLSTPPNSRLPMLQAWHKLLAVLVGVLLAGTAGAASIALEPAAIGPYRVACSNVEQDFSRARGPVTSYWEGNREGSSSQRRRYLSELLINAEQTVSYIVTPPDSRTLFRKHRNTPVQFHALVCYPTDTANPRRPYLLPDGRQVPAMQRGDEAPLLPAACAASDAQCTDGERWPLLVYSHGLAGSPLSSSYLETIAAFASHGYIVAAPFHGDPRFSRVRLEDLSDINYFFRNHAEIVEMQAIRPLAVQGLLDHLLQDPDWAPHIDSERIGGFGASMGGETMLLLAGAELSYNIDSDRRQVTYEPRLQAIVTFVPYSGVHSTLPAFGSDQRGARGIRTPYLGISGSKDDIAPIDMTKRAVKRFIGPRYLVNVKGMGHGSTPEVMPEAYAWYLTFLDAHLHGDRGALSRLYRATDVAGGMEDSLEIAVQTGVRPMPGEAVVQEFHHAELDHYFITAGIKESVMLIDHPEMGWKPTGLAFAAAPLSSEDADLHPVCRFYGDLAAGPNSHFFTAFANECAGLITKAERTPLGQAAWRLEGNAFRIAIPDADGNCADDTPFPVWRAFNRQFGAIVNGRREDPNHRYTIEPDEPFVGDHAGWVTEGVAFCTQAPLLGSTGPTNNEDED